jgi:hypothetical protein
MQVARLLLDALFKDKSMVRALGALVRDDDPGEDNPLAAIELVAFSVTNPEVWIILDLLEVPADIETATGTLQLVISSFSNRSKSVRVQSKYSTETWTQSLQLQAQGTVSPLLPKLPAAHFLQAINDKTRITRWLY